MTFTLVNVPTLINKMTVPRRTFSFAAWNSSRIPFFAQGDFLRSPSRSFSLPPQAEALANIYTIQKSPIQCEYKVIRHSKAKKYIDDEAEESKGNASQTLDVLNTKSSGTSAVYR
jgi:hypothetical protein